MPDLEMGLGLPPFLIWAVVTGMSIILLIFASSIYFWYRSRVRALAKDSEDVAEFAAQKTLLEAEIEQCKGWLDSQKEELLRIEAERKHQEDLRQELANLATQLAEDRQKAEDFRKETTDLQNVVSALAQDRDKIKIETELLEQQRKEAEAARNELQGVKQRCDEEKKKFDELLRNLAENEIKQQSLIGEIAARETQLTNFKNELRQVEEKLNKAKADLTPLEEVVAEKKRVREDRDKYIAEMQELREKVTQLKRDETRLTVKVDELREEAGAEGDEHARYADLLSVSPGCLSVKVFPKGLRSKTEEHEALNKVNDYLRSEGLVFSRRTVNAFHTSLKVANINPLTVLAGISGTGKTLLPIRYAQAMGMYHLVVSVQPRWDSPQDLLGFYNYLEKKYKATDLVRALIRMDKYNFLPEEFKEMREDKRNERVLLVLLDEMNLARVEYYFSEFLSKLELRREVGNPDNPAKREKAEIVLDIGPGSEEGSKFRTWVDRNVLFVGTMNEDESKQSLSDMVLDRANVLRFGRPPHTENAAVAAGANKPEESFLSFEQWKGWIRDRRETSSWDSDVAGWIKGVNDALESIGRPFGHRVAQAIREYILNYPGVEDGRSHKAAFADQVEQKVMPKLRGIDLEEQSSQKALDDVANILEILEDDELYQTFKSAKEDRSSGSFVWRGVTRVIHEQNTQIVT